MKEAKALKSKSSSVFLKYLKTLFKFSDDQFDGNEVKLRLRISGKYSEQDQSRKIYLETYNLKSRCLYLDPAAKGSRSTVWPYIYFDLFAWLYVYTVVSALEMHGQWTFDGLS